MRAVALPRDRGHHLAAARVAENLRAGRSLVDRRRLMLPRLSFHQTRAQPGVRRGIDRRPRHRDRTVEDRLVGRRRDAAGGEFGLMIHRRQRVDSDDRMDRRKH